MATIKLQPSGAVVIKDGKVSCACCAQPPTDCCMYPASQLGVGYVAEDLPERSIDDNWELNLPPGESSIPGYEWDYYYYLSSGTDTYYVLHHDGKWYQGYTDGFRWTIYGPYNCLFEVAQGSLPIFDSSEEGFTPENQGFEDEFAETLAISGSFTSGGETCAGILGRSSLCCWSGTVTTPSDYEGPTTVPVTLCFSDSGLFIGWVLAIDTDGGLAFSSPKTYPDNQSTPVGEYGTGLWFVT